MTWIVVRGIELSARTQIGLLAAEIFTLALFSIVALVKVYSGSAPAGSIHPSPLLDQPLLAQPQRNLRRDAARGLHLLGLGHDRDGERGDRGPRRGAGQGDRDLRP